MRQIARHGTITVLESANWLPVSLDLVRQHCRIPGTYDDTLLTHYVRCASEYLFQFYRVCIVDSKLLWRTDFPFGSVMWLPMFPVREVLQIQYVDTTKQIRALPNTDYEFLVNSVPPFISSRRTGMLVDTQSSLGARYTFWPETDMTTPLSVSITMQAGWPAQELVNAAVQQAVLLLVCYMYEQRLAAVQNPPAEIEHGVRALLANYSLLLED